MRYIKAKNILISFLALVIGIISAKASPSDQNNLENITALAEQKIQNSQKMESSKQAVGLENPALAMNLNAVADWSTQLPFIDLFKLARPWLGFNNSTAQWADMSFQQLKNGGYLDENNWLKQIPENMDFVGSVFAWELPAAAPSRRGRYTLRYEGEGRIIFRGGRIIKSSTR